MHISLAGILLFSTGLSYFWIGPLPLWLLTSLIILWWVFIRRDFWKEIFRFFKALWIPIALPWLIFTLVILLRDFIDGSLHETFTDRFGLNLACLVLFFVCGIMPLLIQSEKVLVVLSAVFVFQAIIAIGQFAGNYYAFRIPEFLSEMSSKEFAYMQPWGDYLISGRVKGLDIFVHKFSAYEGIVAAFLMGIFLLQNYLTFKSYSRYFITACLILIMLSVMFTFSRGPIFSLTAVSILTIFYGYYKAQRFAYLKKPIFAIVSILVLLIVFNIIESKEFKRIRSLKIDGFASESKRIVSLEYSIENFKENIFFGAGSSAIHKVPLATHSVPIRILGDFGLVGFLFYFLVWAGILKVFWKSFCNKQGNNWVIGLACLAASMVAIADNLTHSSGLLQRDTSQAALFGLMVGLCLSERNKMYSFAKPKRLSP